MKKIREKIFGTFSWSAPLWLTNIKNKIAIKMSWPKTIVILVLFSMGLGTYLYVKKQWANRNYITTTLYAPEPTDLENHYVQPILIIFSSSAANPKLLNIPEIKGVSLSPKVPGKWTWLSDTNLQFTPDSSFDWPAGTEYEIDFADTVFAPHTYLKESALQFSTKKLSFEFSKAEFYIHPNRPEIKKIIATVRSNYALNVESFKKHIQLFTQSEENAILSKNNKELKTSISFNQTKNEAYIESEQIEIAHNNEIATISLAEGIEPLLQGEESSEEFTRQVTIPGLKSGLKIDSPIISYTRNEQFESEQVFILNSTLPVKSEDLAHSLEIYLLPEDHKPNDSDKIINHYNWSSVSEVTPAVAAKLEKIDFKTNPTETPYSTLHSFQINAPTNRFLLIKINNQFKGLGGFELANPFSSLLNTYDYPKELQFMTKGSLLSLSSEKKIPLLSRNVEKVLFEIYRIIPEQINHVIQLMENNDSFANPSSFIYDKNMIAEKFTTTQIIHNESKGTTHYFSFDLSPYIKDKKGFFFVVAKSVPLSEELLEDFETDLSTQKLILTTDIGIIAKKNLSENYNVFVQNIHNGLPIHGAQVDVIGRNGLTLLTQTTDDSGQVEFPNLSDFKREKEPIAFVVKSQDDISYLPRKVFERFLNYSRFNTSGIIDNSSSDQINAMLFSDRGIYRPGEEAHLGIILRTKNKISTQKIPLQIKAVDPQGKIIFQEKIQAYNNDFKDISFELTQTTLTGSYEILLSLPENQKDAEQIIGQTSIQVQEFVPDQMKIKLAIDPYKNIGWIPTEKVHGNIELTNLFGSAAQNRLIKITSTLSSTIPEIDKYKDFQFNNPNKKTISPLSEPLKDQLTDAQGKAHFSLDLSSYIGFFKLRFEVEGFENDQGGKSVSAINQVYVSQSPFLFGYKTDGDFSFINKDSHRYLEWIALNNDLEKSNILAKDNYTLSLIQKKYISALMKQYDGSYKYQSVKKEIELKEEPFTLNDHLRMEMPTHLAGDFAYILRNQDKEEIQRVDFTIIGEKNGTRSLERSNELTLILNKKDYSPEEEIEFEMRAPFEGNALISIERDKVYASKWVKTSSQNSTQRIKIPKSIEGNAYLNVMLLRDSASKEIYLNPLSYGVQEFSIDLNQFKNNLTLKTPSKVKPGSTLEIKYQASKASKIILYGVDEGILQVARYQQPDPLNYFFQKKALQVETSQILDLVMPEYSVLKELMSNAAPGGDSSDALLGRNLNPFKRKGQPAVVFWSGVIDATPQEKSYSWKVPETFNGSIKIFAVSNSLNALGSTQNTVTSRGDFILSPSLPNFISPQDKFTATITISNQIESKEKSHKVHFKLLENPYFKIAGTNEQDIEIDAFSEKNIKLDLIALNKIGSPELVFTAQSGSHRAQITSSLSIRPATLFDTQTHFGILRKNESLPLKWIRYNELQTNQIFVASSPLILNSAFESFLEDYPYSCTEQLVSKAFAKLLLQKTNQNSFNSTINSLRERQADDGGFFLYPNSPGTQTPELSLHVIHYLILAKQKGFSIPQDLWDRSVMYLKAPERRTVQSMESIRMFAQTLYLLTRLKIVPSMDIVYLREVLDKKFDGTWQKDTTALYLAAAYAAVYETEKAHNIMNAFGNNFSKNLEDLSLLYAIAAENFPIYLQTHLMQKENFESLIQNISQNGFTTSSASKTLWAFDLMKKEWKKAVHPSSIKINNVTVDNKNILLSNLKSNDPTILSYQPTKNAKQIYFNYQGQTPLFYSLISKGYSYSNPPKEKIQGIEVSRQFLNTDGKALTQIKKGQDVIVSLKIKALDKDIISFSLVDLFPGGFAYSTEQKAEQFTSLSKLSSFIPYFTDAREDRMILYGSVQKGQLLEYKYLLKATHQGEFTENSLFAQDMYDSKTYYRGSVKKIIIK